MKIILIMPSFAAGGLEKVITELAWYFSRDQDVRVIIVCLSKGELFYPLPEGVIIVMPAFSLKEMLRPFYLARLMLWLRKRVKNLNPDALLSFGGKFNSFVLLSVYGLLVRTYISDRSRPTISYGRFLDWLNPIMYRNADGIIAQTARARDLMYDRIAHRNIRVIGNPLKIYYDEYQQKDNIILNVGRFIPSKQQALLVDYFAKIRPDGWKVCFVGDGQTMDDVKQKVTELSMQDDFYFTGVTGNIDKYYRKSKIFAFTSSSEGFPNALGEAMAAGLACISFDCEAGPSDLISDGVNGYLIPEYDHTSYVQKLELLINDELLCKDFGVKAKERISEFSFERIGKQYLDFFKGGKR